MKRVNIAVASPGDVQNERDAILKVFSRWNNTNNEAMLNAVTWEAAAIPTLGDHPQHILNDAIIQKSDLLVAILWSKLGTPTPTASSGTVEEIREFIARKGPRRVLLYFCKRDLPYNTDAEELAKLRKFKDLMKSQGLFHEYTTQEEFERDLYYHLDSKVDEFLHGKLPLPELPPEPKAAKSRESLPADSRLHHPIDFGITLEGIAQGFAARMDQFDALGGVHADKFYALGAHVYSSVAICLDKVLTFSSSGISEVDHDRIERISSKLKRLSNPLPDPKAPWPEFWSKGRDLSDALSTHVGHMNQWKK